MVKEMFVKPKWLTIKLNQRKEENNMATAWNIHLMKVYRDMKKKDSNVKLSAAMKVAKKSYSKK